MNTRELVEAEIAAGHSTADSCNMVRRALNRNLERVEGHLTELRSPAGRLAYEKEADGYRDQLGELDRLELELADQIIADVDAGNVDLEPKFGHER